MKTHIDYLVLILNYDQVLHHVQQQESAMS